MYEQTLKKIHEKYLPEIIVKEFDYDEIGEVKHTEMAEPFSKEIRDILNNTAEELKLILLSSDQDSANEFLSSIKLFIFTLIGGLILAVVTSLLIFSLSRTRTCCLSSVHDETQFI